MLQDGRDAEPVVEQHRPAARAGGERVPDGHDGRRGVQQAPVLAGGVDGRGQHAVDALRREPFQHTAFGGGVGVGVGDGGVPVDRAQGARELDGQVLLPQVPQRSADPDRPRPSARERPGDGVDAVPELVGQGLDAFDGRGRPARPAQRVRRRRQREPRRVRDVLQGPARVPRHGCTVTGRVGAGPGARWSGDQQAELRPQDGVPEGAGDPQGGFGSRAPLAQQPWECACAVAAPPTVRASPCPRNAGWVRTDRCATAGPPATLQRW